MEGVGIGGPVEGVSVEGDGFEEYCRICWNWEGL